MIKISENVDITTEITSPAIKITTLTTTADVVLNIDTKNTISSHVNSTTTIISSVTKTTLTTDLKLFTNISETTTTFVTRTSFINSSNNSIHKLALNLYFFIYIFINGIINT